MIPKLSPAEATGALLSVAPNMKQATGPPECILLTRIAVDVCRACGVLAKPLAVTVELHSDSDPDATVRLGFPDDIEAEDIWDGHLVCVVDRRLLLDLTIDSMTIPEWGLHPQPFSAAIDGTFIEGGSLSSLSRAGRPSIRLCPSGGTFEASRSGSLGPQRRST